MNSYDPFGRKHTEEEFRIQNVRRCVESVIKKTIFAALIRKKGNHMEYTIIIEKDPESGWYVGKCIQVPAAMSQGETLDELMENMKDAISLVLDYYKEKARKSSRSGVFYRKLALV
ncbi:MAG: type II toxin-antitoxin system HicB family antitoxin [Bacteroidales bacterium]|nr:type II toxin-antitoxin system HicB family antitoxin [Bacteroidales bacterium]